MSCRLGVDLGAESTTVAVEVDGGVRVVELDPPSASVPTAFHLDASGRLHVGRAAVERGVVDAAGMVTGLRAAAASGANLVLRDETVPAERALARFVDTVVALAAERVGREPTEVVVTHPASWPMARCEAFEDELNRITRLPAILLGETEAVALARDAGLASEPAEVIALGAAIAVSRTTSTIGAAGLGLDDPVLDDPVSGGIVTAEDLGLLSDEDELDRYLEPAPEGVSVFAPEPPGVSPGDTDATSLVVAVAPTAAGAYDGAVTEAGPSRSGSWTPVLVAIVAAFVLLAVVLWLSSG